MNDLDFDEFDDDLKPPKRARGNRRVGVIMALVVVLMVAVGMVLAGLQSGRGCALVADYFKQETGLDVKIGSAWLTFPLDLVMADVELKPEAAKTGVFKAREIRVGWRWGETLPVKVTGLHLEFRKTADGWTPAGFERLASLDDVLKTDILMKDEPRGLVMEVEGATLIWRNSEGDVTAAVHGLNAGVTPLEARGRFFRLIEVTADAVKRAGGQTGRAVRRVWIAAPGAPYLELDYRGTWEGDAGKGTDWWSAPGHPSK